MATFGAFSVAEVLAVAGYPATVTDGQLPVEILLLANLSGQAAAFACAAGIVVSANRLGLSGLLRLVADVRREDLVLVAKGWAVAVVSGSLMEQLGLRLGLRHDPTVFAVATTTPVGLAQLLVGAPLWEELWGRGLLYGALRRRGPRFALYGTTFITAALHLDPLQAFSVVPCMLVMRACWS